MADNPRDFDPEKTRKHTEALEKLFEEFCRERFSPEGIARQQALDLFQENRIAEKPGFSTRYARLSDHCRIVRALIQCERWLDGGHKGFAGSRLDAAKDWFRKHLPDLSDRKIDAYASGLCESSKAAAKDI